MANLKASDNPFPSVLFEEATEPAAPAVGHQRLYVDSTSHALMIVDSTGTETAVGGGGSGDVATDAIWDAAGDLVQGTGANTAAKLTAGTAGMFLQSAGAAAANLWAFPSGHELDYVEITSSGTSTATTEGTATAIITGNAVAYDGSTRIKIEAWFTRVVPASGAVHNANSVLYDGSSSIGLFALPSYDPAVVVRNAPTYLVRFLTPSNATHTYSIRGFVDSGTGTWVAAAGGSGNAMPAWMRITKA